MAQEREELGEQQGAVLRRAVGSRIVRGAMVVVFYWLFWKLGGFLINLLVARYFGKGPVTDAFTAVYNNLVFLLFFSSVLKIVLPAFMPLFAEGLRKDEAAAWRFANTVLNMLMIVSVVVGALTFVFARPIVATLLPRFAQEEQDIATTLLKWMAPGVLVLFFAIVAQAILNCYKVFSYPSAADATQKLVWAGAVFTAISVLGLTAEDQWAPNVIGAGFLFGCLAQAVVLFAGLRKRLGRYRPAFTATNDRRLLMELFWLVAAAGSFALWLCALEKLATLPEDSLLHVSPENVGFLRLTGAIGVGCLYALCLWVRARGRKGIMARFVLLAMPLVVGVLFGRYRDLTSSYFQSYTAEGDYSIIEWAKKIMNLPVVLVGYSLAVAMFPYLCDLAAGRAKDELGRVVGRTLKMIALFFVPLVIVTIVLAGPVMQLLWDRGDWKPDDTLKAGMALGILAASIFFLAVENVLMQSFFSLQRMVLPTALGIGFALFQTAILYVGVMWLGFDDPLQAFILVCAAYTVARGLKNLCLYLCLRRRLPLMSWREGVVFLAKLLMICAVMGGAVWGARLGLVHAFPLRPLSGYGGSKLVFFLVKAVHVGVPGLAGLVAFLGGCVALKVEEFRIIVQWVRERGWKKRPKPGSASDSVGGEGA